MEPLGGGDTGPEPQSNGERRRERGGERGGGKSAYQREGGSNAIGSGDSEFQVTSKSTTPHTELTSPFPFIPFFRHSLLFVVAPLLSSAPLPPANPLSLSLRHPRPSDPLKRPQCYTRGTVNWGKRLLVLGREDDVLSRLYACARVCARAYFFSAHVCAGA